MKKLLLMVVGLSLVVCGLGFGFLAWFSTSLFGEPTWSATSIPPAQAVHTFGVSVPPEARAVQSRQSGFQDPYFELLFELPEAQVDAYLASQHLTRSAVAMVQVPTEVESVTGMKGAPKGEGLEGLQDRMSADGGFVELFRSATLLQWPGHTFIYLVAFGT